MAKCNECIHENLCYSNCDNGYDSDDCTCHYCTSVTCPEVTKCEYFEPKSRFVELPIKATNELKSELEKYCFERCVDEL